MKPQNNETSISKANDEVQPLHAGKGLLRLAEKAVLKVHQKMGLEKKFSEVQFIYKVKKVFYIVFYWTLFSIAQDCYDLLVLGNYAVLKVDIYIGLFILTNTFTTLLGGIIGGFIIIFYLERLWRTRSVGYTLIMMSLFYTLIIFVAVGIGSLIYQSYAQGLAFYHPEVISETMINFANPNFFKNYLTWWLVAFATIVLLQVNDKYGPGVLLDLVFGNYHKPKSEERIFMFLDLRASTKTAEHMSEEAYFNYIRDFFMDTTDPILETKGEIYQYVGDEIVVSWKMKNGLEQANALRCFFFIQQAIERNKACYQNKYNYVPGFKAGFHFGKVTTGEIGIVKKDITFTGDVLNTTSRIQSKCNELGLDLLISNDLLRLMPLGNNMQRENVGEVSLKGKESKIALSTVKMV